MALFRSPPFASCILSIPTVLRAARHLVASVLVVLVPLTSYAQDSVTLNFVNVDIPSVVKAIGGHTGKNFIIDPRVTGNMNLQWNTPVPKDAAYQILLSALRVSGYAAIEERGVVKIVPEADAKTSGGVVDGKLGLSGDRIVTQVFALQNENAAQLATVLRPLVPPNNFLVAYPGNNSIVITDYAENVKRIAKIIAMIDLPTSSELQMLKLQYASAVDVANLLKGLMPEASINPSTPGILPKLAIGVEPRTNSLIVRADTPALLARIKSLIAGIDVAGSATGNVHVVYLRNAEATKLVDTLRQTLSSSVGLTNANTNTTAATTPNLTNATTPTASSSSNVQYTIQADAATNALVITAPEHIYNGLRQVIDKLDQRRAQVAVEALIVELSTSLASELGIQWQDLSGLRRGDGTQIIGGTNFSTQGNIISAASNLTTIGGGLNLGIVRGTVNIPGVADPVIGLAGLAKALEGDQRAKILANPVIMTLDNEEGKFVVGQNVPFISGSFTTNNSGATNPFQTITRQDIGLTLKVTPLITQGGAVRLKILNEISSVAPTPTTNSFLRPADLITNKRLIETTVLVDDGMMLALGGLIQDDAKSSDSKVPLLGDIPGLGLLFKYQTKTNERTNLMVFLRPVVLRSGETTEQFSTNRYSDLYRESNGVLPATPTLLRNDSGAQLGAPAPSEKVKPTVTPTPLLQPPQTK